MSVPNYRWLLWMVLLAFLPHNAEAQLEEMRLGLHWNPLALVDFYQGGSLRLGGRLQVAPRYSLLVEGGPYLAGLSYNVGDLTGYNFRAELAYNYSSWYYWSLSYFYKDHAYSLTDDLLENGQVVDRTYGLQKYVHSIGFRWGRLRWKHGASWFLDLYGGMGLRWRNVRRDGLAAAELTNLQSDSIVYEFLRRSGQRWSPEFSIGLRLGGILWRKNRLK
ncbi:MAG: hypothetical protein AAFW73_00785 [Bacteroidota bacterium]